MGDVVTYDELNMFLFVNFHTILKLIHFKILD